LKLGATIGLEEMAVKTHVQGMREGSRFAPVRFTDINDHCDYLSP
jgi:hypothetical protein